MYRGDMIGIGMSVKHESANRQCLFSTIRNPSSLEISSWNVLNELLGLPILVRQRGHYVVLPFACKIQIFASKSFLDKSETL